MGSTASQQHERLSDDQIDETNDTDQALKTPVESGQPEIRDKIEILKSASSSSVREHTKSSIGNRQSNGFSISVNKNKPKPPISFGRSASSVDTSYFDSDQILLGTPTMHSARNRLPVLRSMSSPLLLDGQTTSGLSAEYMSADCPDGLGVGDAIGFRRSDDGEKRKNMTTPPEEGATNKPSVGRRRNVISPVTVNFNIRAPPIRSLQYSKFSSLAEDELS